MRVVIPAAGAGQRFRTAGYKEPKPLIPVRGMPMIMHILEMVGCVDPLPIVMCDQDVAERLTMDCVAVPVPYIQQGAALTVLLAGGWLKDNEPVMVVDCDNLIQPHYFQQFTRYAAQRVHDGAAAICTTMLPDNDTSTAWSFVHGYGGKVGYVREKERVSNRATAGVNVFPTWRHLRTAICKMVADPVSAAINGEYYLAPAFNYVDCEVGYDDIPLAAFNSVGTPELLQAYERKYAHS